MSSQEPDIFAQVFNQKSLMLMAFGALGGSVRAAVLKTSWREGLRVVFVGGAVSFGVGVMGPSLLSPLFSNLGSSSSMGALTTSAFLLGLISVTIVERILSRLKGVKS